MLGWGCLSGTDANPIKNRGGCNEEDFTAVRFSFRGRCERGADWGTKCGDLHDWFTVQSFLKKQNFKLEIMAPLIILNRPMLQDPRIKCGAHGVHRIYNIWESPNKTWGTQCTEPTISENLPTECPLFGPNGCSSQAGPDKYSRTLHRNIILVSLVRVDIRVHHNDRNSIYRAPWSFACFWRNPASWRSSCRDQSNFPSHPWRNTNKELYQGKHTKRGFYRDKHFCWLQWMKCYAHFCQGLNPIWMNHESCSFSCENEK